MKRPNVVLVVMDEFPGDSLLDRHRRIDPVRYPNFAALASDSTWFRNAYSVYDSTTKAVPLILDGMRPRPGHVGRPQRPPALDLRRLRPRTATAIVDSEEASALCPPSICRGARTRGRRSSRTCSAADRSASTAGCARSGRQADPLGQAPAAAARPLPLPARRVSARGPRPRDPLHGMNTVPGFHDEFLTRHNEQRYLLQLGFADRLLGQLLRQLKRAGIYDDTLVVVTADHGIAFQVGVQTRRSVSQSNVEELTPIPLIRQAPRPASAAGSATSTPARSTSPRRSRTCSAGGSATAPTGTRPSAAATARRHSVSLTTRDFSSTVRISGKRWEARRARWWSAACGIRLRRPRRACSPASGLTAS